MKVQLVTPYRVSHLQRYGVTVRGNVTSVDPPYDCGIHFNALQFCPPLTFTVLHYKGLLPSHFTLNSLCLSPLIRTCCVCRRSRPVT